MWGEFPLAVGLGIAMGGPKGPLTELREGISMVKARQGCERAAGSPGKQAGTALAQENCVVLGASATGRRPLFQSLLQAAGPGCPGRRVCSEPRRAVDLLMLAPACRGFSH